MISSSQNTSKRATIDWPECKGPAFACLPAELVSEIFSYCDVHDLVQLGRTSRKYGTLIREYLSHRIHQTFLPFFTDVCEFRETLRSCDALVSGSAALHILLPPKSTTWVPTDLDIYVPHPHFHYLSVLLQQEHGYHLIQEGNANVNPYTFSLIRSVATFSKGNQHIDVIVSKTAAIGPILQFHSTAVMNFIDADNIFCAYPALTFQNLARINPGPLYFDRFRRRTISALWKYAGRGFRFINCKTAPLSKYSCKSIGRSLTDAGCMWINVNNLPYASATPINLFRQYGFLDVQWTLGGMVCGSQVAFQDARIHVVNDQSCVQVSTRMRSLNSLHNSVKLGIPSMSGSLEEDGEYDNWM